MKKFLLVIFAFLSYQCWSQGNMIAISSTVPSQMTICGASKSFTISIYNPSPFTLTSDTLKLTMPAGIIYQTGSIAGATYLFTTAPNTAVFILADIPTLTSLNISFSALANCDVMAYIAGGGIVENKIRVNYTANNTPNYDILTTSTYIIRQPNLSITNVSNQSYTGNIGDIFTRCITITNSGLGELSQFTFTDVHGSGILVTAISIGSWTNAGVTETIVLNGTNFSSIGNGDNFLGNGESITICETIKVLDCISVASAFEANWGCYGSTCQFTVSNANVFFPNLIPNLVITPNNGSYYFQTNSCVTQASPQQLTIANTGLGQATNVQLDIFQSTGTGYTNSVGSYIDPASFTIQIGSSAPSSITPTSTEITTQLGCMAPTAIGRVFITIPSINAGETIYIKWNTYSCCWNGCTGVGQYYINGWRYKGTYNNICQSSYVIPEDWGKVYSYIYGELINNSSPSTMVNGQTGTFDFSFSNYSFWYPIGTGAHWKLEFTLPPCLTYSGNLQILHYDGLSNWAPSSVTIVGNVVTAIFSGSAPFDLNQAEIKIDLTVNCAGCGNSGSNGSVSIKSSYIPDTSCGCEVVVSCQSAAVSIICPSPCPEGLIFSYFEMKRTSYGLPDNEAGGGDGIPDGSGSLDFTKIKTDRVMFGDTLTTKFIGNVRGTVHPSWLYCYATSSMSNGGNFSFLDASLTIYRGGVPIISCNNFTPTVTNSGTTFAYDLSVPSNACLTGFTYLPDDSILFKPRYKVTGNITWTIVTCNAANEFYMSDIANPVLPANKFQCGSFNGNCTILGYGFYNCCGDNYSVKSCDGVTISQNYYFWVGTAWQQYRNSFPYEYRNWAHIKILTSIVPVGYTFVSAILYNYRTAGTNQSNTSSFTITPINPNSDTLLFPVEQYFEGYGGTIPLGDEGFAGTLELVVKPSCKVTPTITQSIGNDWTFATTENISGAGSYPTFNSVIQDNIIYQAPDLFLQSLLPSIVVPDKTASWVISISNTSNISNALNTWLSGPTISGVSILSVVDLGTNLPITPIGGIYPVGTVNASAMRSFRITAAFTSCAMDSIIVHSGWNCDAGYPDSLAVYPCSAKTITLKLTPLMPAFAVNITGPPGTINLCDTASYTVEGVNILLGTAYDVKLVATLPIGVAIVPGSSSLSYPASLTYSGIPDPLFIGGTVWQWDISAINTIIQNNGLKGITLPDSNSLKITFKVITSCGYTSGSIIGFVLIGKAACGLSMGQEVSLSSELGITGASTPYHTVIDLTTTYISPCANTSIMKVIVHNLGPAVFTSVDSVIVQLPADVSFINSSFTGLHNPPGIATPTQFTLNGCIYLVWRLPPGVIAGDSSVFSFGYSGDPHALSCGISQFIARTTSSTDVFCLLNSCGINITTGDTTLSVFTYKAYLSLSNAQASSIPNPPGGETVTLNLDITNTGQAIMSGANSIMQFYYDANGNGIYNTGDIFISQDTLMVNNNATVPYTHSFDVPAGQACSIIAVVDTAVNPCVCNPSQIHIQPILISLGNDTAMCSGQTAILSSLSVTGYTYSWTPAIGLNNATISNPLLTTSNTTAAPDSTVYILTTTRLGCSSKDTIKITVNPIPVSNAGTDTTICAISMTALLGIAPSTGYTYLWSPANGLSSATTSNPTATLATSGVTTYTVTTTTFGCSSTDSVKVNVNPLPTATITGTTSVCLNTSEPLITFFGNGSVAPYTIIYEINGITQTPIIITSGDSIAIPAPTNTSGTFIYSLVSIQDSTTTACFQIQTGTATITVKPKSIADFVFTKVCNGNATHFTDNSTTPSGAISTWEWDLGDGSPVNNTQTFSYIYSGAGIDTVTLIVGNSLGCTDTVIKNVQVYYNPTAYFTHNNVCFGDTIHFHDSSYVNTSTSIASYLWVFGDGSTTSTLQNPEHYYSAAGSYIVTFVATTANGCADVENITVKTFDPPTTGFTFNNTCLFDSALFTNTSQNPTMGTIANWSWNFGDNSPLNISTWNPTHQYLIPGNYELTLVTFSSNLGCPDTLHDTITVFPMPVADFSAADICLYQAMNFYDSSTVTVGTISDWSWNSGDSTPLDSIQNLSHNYTNATTYSVSLIATSINGCKDTIAKTVVVHPLPDVEFSTANVCDGSMASFSDNSTISITDSIQFQVWDFGDNSTVSTSQNTSHLYTGSGSYDVQLTVFSSFGCYDSISKTVIINPNPNVNFSANDTLGCELLCVYFQDASSIDTGVNTQWTWTDGNGNLMNTAPDFEHCYANDSVFAAITYSVTLTVTSDSGCISSLSKPDYITVFPRPEAGFSAQPQTTTIMDPIISVLDASKGTNFWLWNFGDQETSSGITPSPHTYADTGTYTITLVTSNQYGCVDTSFQTIIIDPDFAFYIPNSFTPNDDGVNDSFSGKGVFIKEYKMMIYDRWGNLVFFSNDINDAWDGKANYGDEIAQRDVYIYVINLIDFKLKEHKYKGHVTLVK